MAPKRDSAGAPEDVPEAKRRVTRSATAKKSAPAAAKKVLQKSSESKRRSKKAVVSKDDDDPHPHEKSGKYDPRHGKNNPAQGKDNPAQGKDNPAHLSITHDSVKKPIACHHYSTTSSASSADKENSLPPLIFTHGAGGTLAAPAVVHFCTGYASAAAVFVFQGSMNLGARVKAFHACRAHVGAGEHVVLGGRSMGARAAVMAATEAIASESEGLERVSLVLVSYPLKGPKGDVRNEILEALPGWVRVLFVVGERDAMCPLELLEETRGKIKARSKVVVVQDADHGMKVKPVAEEKRLGEEAGRMAAAWVSLQGSGDEDEDEDEWIR